MDQAATHLAAGEEPQGTVQKGRLPSQREAILAQRVVSGKVTLLLAWQVSVW